MDKAFHALFSAFLIMGLVTEVSCRPRKHGGRQGDIRKLFAFGDSYADTGNLGKLSPDLTRAWYHPYGITFPHRPTGRFSDGRLLTDFIASFLGIKSPVPFKVRRVGSKLFSYGMNFAVGGSGVFDNEDLQRNLSAQIDTFESQIKERVFSEFDLKSSVALVSISGNDYVFYVEEHGVNGLMSFIVSVVNQLKVDLKRIHDLGVKKVVVTNLHPLGCTPFITQKYSYAKCNDTIDFLVAAHNSNLEQAVAELGGGSNSSAFQILDLHTSFLSVINGKGWRKFDQILKPCCEAKKGFDCGQTDGEGVKLYKVCGTPEDYFYWDSVHPTQAGWGAIFESIRPWLSRTL